MLPEIFRDSPWWVYLIILALLLLGLKSTRPRIITVRRIFLIPIIFTLWNVAWLSERIHAQFHLLVFWAIGLCLGAFIGWIMIKHWKIVKKKGQMWLPPTYSNLVLILIIFCIRYFFVFQYEMHPEVASHLFKADASISGVLTGIFIGRAYHLYSEYIKIKS